MRCDRCKKWMWLVANRDVLRDDRLYWCRTCGCLGSPKISGGPVRGYSAKYRHVPYEEED